ncbi:hypothetical protein VNO77_42197 [Canavalia gladiata]|uniref:Uncharacterized protein n=1 Tax=Canavalia gladiata TaxID=3824 RepID=A0AAN9K279_CANGL
MGAWEKGVHFLPSGDALRRKKACLYEEEVLAGLFLHTFYQQSGEEENEIEKNRERGEIGRNSQDIIWLDYNMDPCWIFTVKIGFQWEIDDIIRKGSDCGELHPISPVHLCWLSFHELIEQALEPGVVYWPSLAIPYVSLTARRLMETISGRLHSGIKGGDTSPYNAYQRSAGPGCIRKQAFGSVLGPTKHIGSSLSN